MLFIANYFPFYSNNLLSDLKVLPNGMGSRKRPQNDDFIDFFDIFTNYPLLMLG
jgi:hypothetical protein